MADTSDTVAIELPITPVIDGQRVGAFRVSTVILGVPYIIDGRWNSRANFDPDTLTWSGAWYIDILEVDLKPIVYGMKIVLGTYLGRRSNHKLFREGVLVAVDMTGGSVDATYDTLGTRVVLEYIPVKELLRRLRMTTGE
jgi:hypothetical protein